MENQTQVASDLASDIQGRQSMPLNDRVTTAEALDEVISERRKTLGIAPASRPKPLEFNELLKRVGGESLETDRRAEQFDREQFARHAVERLERLKSQAGRSYESKTLANFSAKLPKQKAVVDAVREFIASLDSELRAGRGIVLFGPCGTGKDHLLFQVCRTAVAAGRDVTWINAQDWFGDIRDDMDDDRGLSERQRIERLAHAPVLMLSDPTPPFGNVGQHMATMLYRLMARRADSGLSTFASINVENDAEACERIGEPTWDRLCDKAWKMFCDWPTYRNPHRRVNMDE